MSQRQTSDADLGDRLRASIDSGDLPALDLADVRRRADRRTRRRTVGTTVVAGAGALVLVGVLAVAVPAINAVIGDRTTSSATTSGPDQAEVDADPSGDLADASLWAALPSLNQGRGAYLTPARVASAVGAGDWDDAATDILSPWATERCGPSPLRGAVYAEPGVGPPPSSSYLEPWAAQPSQSPPASGAPSYAAAGFLSVLRWESTADTAGRDWQRTTGEEAAACPGAVRLSPEATIATMPVTVIAQPPLGEPVVVSDASWSAMAITAGGPTVVQAHYVGGSSAQAAGDAALALLREAVRAVAAGDRAAVQVDGGARGGGVEQDRLADFTDRDRGNGAPPLNAAWTPPRTTLDSEDLEAALPGTGSWQNQPIAGTGMDWLRSWCAPGGFVDAGMVDRPGDPLTGGVPGSEETSIWEGSSAAGGVARVDVDVLRWHPRDLSYEESGPAGVDGIALDAAETWGSAMARDATACPGAVTLDATGLPGAHATVSAVRDGDRWRVQAVVVGGPTAVRVRTTLAADDAASAGDQAVATARRVIANTLRADDITLGRADPGPLP